MLELDKKEMVIRYGAIGFGLGILASLIVHMMLLQALEMDFSFKAIGVIHQNLWYLYIIDFLSLPGLFLGIVMGNWRFKQMNILSTRIQQEAEKNNEIEHFTHALIAGDLNTSISFTHTDQTLSESINKLKDSLIKNREMERQRRLDERQRNWISEGLAEWRCSSDSFP